MAFAYATSIYKSIRAIFVATWFSDCVIIEVVAGLFGQQEQVFVGLRASVCYALRHGIGLVPDNILP